MKRQMRPSGCAGMSRRRFLQTSAYASAGVTALPLMPAPALLAATADSQVVPAPTRAWMAATPASHYSAYRSKRASSPDTPTWVQIDLGASHTIDFVKVYPANERLYPGRDQHWAGEGFPVRFKLEAADEPDFQHAATIADHTAADYADPKGRITRYQANGIKGRYVRLTATRLRRVARQSYYLALGKIGVHSGGREISIGCPVAVETRYGEETAMAQLTRAPRPDGEEVFMNHPGNVTAPSTWKPALYQARAPLGGVRLHGGLFQRSMENNIGYLLNSYSVDELLRQFRERAGKPNPANLPPPKTRFWEEDLAGSNAGRFLMGAGNTLRWMEHPELRRRLNAVVDGIAECRQPNGYIMAYPEDTIFFSERAAYTRAWVTHGLVEAGYAGNPRAFDLLRGYYDWFNRCSYLPYMQRFAVQGGQGMIANTRLYFTPVGQPRDIQVIQQYHQENHWLEQLAARQESSVWQYPYDRPHCYLLTDFEAYLDLYRATGEPRYLQAMEGGWDLFHTRWENPGGSTAIIEYVVCPPKSYRLDAQLEELCGNSFWVFLSQRFHLLRPSQEKYVNEIEKSIYNVALANQAGANGFRYHALLTRHKEAPTQINSCCEGQGTRLIGSLPEHVYSIAPDGLYVNLFEASTIQWRAKDEEVGLRMSTRFPFDPAVELRFSAARPTGLKIRVRVPAWAAHPMPVRVNGQLAGSGQPGSYITLDRTWAAGDSVRFTLPAALRLTRYTGINQVAGEERYCVQFGPILLAAVGAPEVRLECGPGGVPDGLLKRLRPKRGEPLHFTVEENPGIEFMPYWQVDEETFNCFPALV